MTFWRRALDKILRSFFQQGELVVTWVDGTTSRYGNGIGPKAAVKLHNDALERALIQNTDMAIGEGYTDGTLEFENDGIEDFFKVALTNREAGTSTFFKASRHIRHIARSLMLRNPIGQAQANVAHHYDLSEKLYDLFLDEDRQYSCAYFARPDMTLEDAQLAKKRHIARKLRLEPGMRVIDIGCGWGGMALTLASEFGVNVVGVTLSSEQHKLARERVAKAGLEDKIDIRLQDYREVPESFDRAVSVGMFEHVGPRNYGEYFRHLDRLLGDNGVALIHTIAGSGPPRVTSPWITKYIFPGGHIPALSEIAPHFEKQGYELTDLEVWRLHYAETLRHWHDRFMAHADEAEALYDARFVRMWRYYLKASEMTFRHGRQVVAQMQFAKRHGEVPLTRDYIYS